MNDRNVLLMPLVCALLLLAAAGCAMSKSPEVREAQIHGARARVLRGVRGTYSQAPRLTNGHVNVPLLIDQLLDIHANTYSFAIHGGPDDWDDLQLFLPAARKHGIRVWVRRAAFRIATEIHTLRRTVPPRLPPLGRRVRAAKPPRNQSGRVSIDDFTHNLKTVYTPEHGKNDQCLPRHQPAPRVCAVLLFHGHHSRLREEIRTLARRILFSLPG